MRNEKIEEVSIQRDRLLMLVGGFLGAGKTTLIGRTVRMLADQGVDCGVVTNDQAAGLVDTALLESSGAESVAEVSGGCFCCRLEDLVAVLTAERAGEESPAGKAGASSPQVIIAEPVGSCTDLVSTVLLPLERVYQVPFRIAPLSVVVDARRALSSLGGRRTPGDFSKDVGYIYRKQLEEAEIVVVNKADLIASADLEDLLHRLSTAYPGKRTFVLSAKTGEGVSDWLEHVLASTVAPDRLMEMDYARYGAGEALLGWMNARVEIGSHDSPVLDGDATLLELATTVSQALATAEYEVAHFKMSLQDEEGRLGTVNQVMSGFEPEISRPFGGTFRKGVLTVNLRAEGDPEALKSVVVSVLEGSVGCRLDTLAAFRPGQPVPTARVTVL